MEPGKEVSESRKATKSEKLQIVFIILMLLAIAALVFAIVQILKNKDMLQNPLGYNLDRFNIQSCKCIDNSGKSFDIYALGYKPVSINEEINLTPLLK